MDIRKNVIYGQGNCIMQNYFINLFNSACKNDLEWQKLSKRFKLPVGLRERLKKVELHPATEYPDRRHSPSVCNCQRCYTYSFACTARSMVWDNPEPGEYAGMR